MERVGKWAVISILLSSCASTIPARKAVVSAALSPKGERDRDLEATLRVLDAHPEYVDELFEKVKRPEHHATLDRFLEATAKGLEDDSDLARRTAQALVAHPKAIDQVQTQVLQAADGHPDAQRAIAKSIAGQAQAATRALLAYPPAIELMTAQITLAVIEAPPARAAFLQAITSEAPTLAALLENDRSSLFATTFHLTQAATRNGRAARVMVPIIVEGLRSKQLSRDTARELARHPDVLAIEEAELFHAISGNPAAERAVAKVVEANAEEVARALEKRPSAVTAATVALLQSAVGNPPITRAVMDAMRKERDAITQLLLSDPKTAEALAITLGKRVLKKGVGGSGP